MRAGPLLSYESAVRVVAAIMVAEMGLPLPSRFTVFVYPSRTAYAEGLATSGRMPARRAEEIAAYSVGLGQHRRLFINDEALRGTCRRAWLAVVTHELTHSAQYELSGGRRGRSEQWLREGMADWVAARVLDRLGDTTFRAERSRVIGDIARMRPALGDESLDLVDLGQPRGWETRHLRAGDRRTYRLAFLVTDELIRRSGWARLVEYFRAFVDSDDRFDNFRQAFGLSLDEFERDALGRLRNALADRESTIDEPTPVPDSSRELPAVHAATSCGDLGRLGSHGERHDSP